MFRNTPQPLDLAKAVYSVAMLAVFLFLSMATAQAAQVSLAWDPSTSSNVAGYRIYYRQASDNYSNICGSGAACKDTGKQTSSTLTGLQDGVPYYFVVKAYDTSTPPIESGPSNEVCQPCASSTAPTANFSASSTSGAPLKWNFTDTSTGTPTSWSWKFGDGSTSTVQTPPTHTYTTAGSYTVSLTATNSAGQ